MHFTPNQLSLTFSSSKNSKHYQYFSHIRSLIQILSLLFFVQINSQIRVYEFSFCGLEQTVKIFQKKNDKITGLIETNFNKKDSNQKIIKTERIKTEIARTIINEIEKVGINNLKNCDDKIETGDTYLDGDYYTVKVTVGKNVFQKVYNEIYPESETKIIEKNNCRRNVQIIATIIDKHINLKSFHRKQLNKLGYDTCYWSGISEVCSK